MNLDRYGPFMNVVAAASALAATFSVLLLKMFGGLKRWTWLSSGAPPFLVTAGVRVLAVALMAVTYVTIRKDNYGWFAGAAILCGVLGFIVIARFDRMRERHVTQVPLVGADGKALKDQKQRDINENVVVGLEGDLRDDIKAVLKKARKDRPGLSVRQFMSGFGPQRVNDPEGLWDSGLLANIRSNLTITLMCALLLGVMAIFLGAFTIEVYNR